MDAAIDGRFFWMLTGSVNTGNPFRESSAWNGKRRVSWKIEDGLRRVESERDGLEEILKRPTAGEMNADATSRLTEASADLKQLRAQSFDLRRSQGPRQVQSEEVDEVVRATV